MNLVSVICSVQVDHHPSEVSNHLIQVNQRLPAIIMPPRVWFIRIFPGRRPRPEMIMIDPLALYVREVDLMIDKNSIKHHTNQYEITKRPYDAGLVIRRGQPFTIKINFQRGYRSSNDVVNLVFRVKGLSHNLFLIINH